MKKLMAAVLMAGVLVSGYSFADDQATEKMISEANSAARSGDLTKAMSKVNEYISASPASARGYALRAHVHFANDHFEDALQDFTQAIALDKNNTRYLVERGLCHYAMGHDQLAIYDIEKAMEIKPESKFAKAMHAKITKEMEDERMAKGDAPLKVKNGVVNMKKGVVRFKQKKSRS
ncbi:MAG: tetratricopeptide repeat protein [Chlamydiales bacterium]|nr:tetratricopeptide repeat protein [Chlamydiia bacterium]MCP5507558.1 tetratricopeptide repeat protein [Chlamydiales bacterium]